MAEEKTPPPPKADQPLADEEVADEVEVLVDGMPLGMASFVRTIVATVVVGLVTSLKGAEKAQEIQISVRRRR